VRLILKKKILLLILAAALTASAFAQGWGREKGQPGRPDNRPRQMMPRGNPGPYGNRGMMPEGRENFRRPDMETVTVSGSLIVAHGRPAIKSGDVTFLVGRLNSLTGFVEGLKEGAQVTIEGSALSRQKEDKTKFLMPTKLTLNGKSYDMSMPGQNLRNENPGERGRRQDPRERNNQHGKQRWNYL